MTVAAHRRVPEGTRVRVGDRRYRDSGAVSPQSRPASYEEPGSGTVGTDEDHSVGVPAAPERSPLDIIERMMVEYRMKADPGLTFLIGFLVGREWDKIAPQKLESGEVDSSRLVEWLETYFEATGRKRHSS